jgi:molybdate transport system substrate-binding protein
MHNHIIVGAGSARAIVAARLVGSGHMKTCCAIFAIINLGIFVAIAEVRAATGAEIKVFTARAGATVLDKIRPEFERTTGHKLNVIYDPIIGGSLGRIRAGESFDVLVLSPPIIDGLIRDGKIIAETRTNLFRSAMGLEVRAGTLKPDVNSVEAFKRTLLNAKSIGYLKVVNKVEELIERLGLTEAVKSKVVMPNSDVVSELVSKGELELGIVVMTQILTTPGVELVGPLPPDIQYHIQFTAGVSANSMAPDAARELIKFLTGQAAIPVIKSQGMEPG